MKNDKDPKVDLSNCDTEPIHLIGRIQAHAYLLILDSATRIIRQVSENIDTLTGIPADRCLNGSLDHIFPEAVCTAILAGLDAGTPLAPFPVEIGQPFYCFPHCSAGSLLLEFEPAYHHAPASLNRLNTFLGRTIQRLGGKETMQELSACTAGQIQQLLDFDQVMIYQFDQDWHGNVIAEKAKEGVRSYYNHHFPASDIPLQVRALLVKNTVRQIADVGAGGVAIAPYFNPDTGAPTDVSSCQGRNSSEIHLEYLRNMGVASSLSLSILVKGKLWGLIICHNHAPRFLDYPLRNTAMLITHYYASSILSTRETADQALIRKYSRAEKALVAQMEENLNITEGLLSGPVSLLDVSGATGAAIALEDKITTLGECPGTEEIREMIEWASREQLPAVYTTREFSRHYPAASAFREVASGVMIIEISKHNRDYMLCFKPEIKEKISWAGNPDQSVRPDGHKKLHPRKSFERWVQEVEGKSSPWSWLEEERAASLSKSVISIQLKRQAEKLRSLNGQLEAALRKLQVNNAQLEDFTRIASHNLLAPLHNIQALIRHYHSESDFDTAQFTLENVETVSANMHQTLTDLHQILALSAGGEIKKENLDIGRLIDKEKQNLAFQIGQTGARITTNLEVRFMEYPRIYLESILHNFLSNALKYRSPARKPEITLKTWQENGQVLLRITDNGRGINLEKHGHKLFGLYKTFHRQLDSRGLGLYLVKKQVDALGGTIQVESREEEGTQFTVRFDTSA